MAQANKKRGSALVTAIWTIAVISLLAISFAGEAFIQMKVNLYIRERVHVNKLTDAGAVLAEAIITKYADITDLPDDYTEADLQEKLEDDRWYEEKWLLKQNKQVIVGPIATDEQNPEAGTVTIEIKAIGGGETGGPKININNLFNGEGGNSKYADWWECIIANSVENPEFIPEILNEERYFDVVVDSWCDWRDEDEVKCSENGAEEDWYKEKAEDEDSRDFYYVKPRNGEIADLKELENIRGFMKDEEEEIDYSAFLTGGALNYTEEKEENRICVKPITRVLDVVGGDKINVNLASRDVLMTIPGICQKDGRDGYDIELAGEIVDAILATRDAEPVSNGGRKLATDDETGPFKDWNDLVNRTEEQIGSEAQEYLSFDSADAKDGAQYSIVITGRSLGVTHSVKAVGVIKDKRVRYIRWEEDP